MDSSPDLAGQDRALIHIIAVPLFQAGTEPHCDGQVMILNDILGLNFGPVHPTCVKEYAALGEAAVEALKRFADDVRAGGYPGPGHSY